VKEAFFMSAALTESQIQEALRGLDGWAVENSKLLKVYKLKDFKAALAFINQIGAEAERLDHHPEIHNSWNRVTLRLCTHDAGGQITEKDLTLARAIQSLSFP
jgi:4a-hydroxytetrahydrobiopterin dehydratase